MIRTKIKLDNFKKALNASESIYLKPIDENRVNIDATIQRFEFTFELAWKFLKAYFLDQGLQLNYPKEVIREAFTADLIENEDIWIKMLIDRNMTSHTYNEKLADEIYNHIRIYVPELKKLLDKLKV